MPTQVLLIYRHQVRESFISRMLDLMMGCRLYESVNTFEKLYVHVCVCVRVSMYVCGGQRTTSYLGLR